MKAFHPGFALFFAWSCCAAASAGEVSPDVDDALARDGRACVFVTLKAAPAADAPEGGDLPPSGVSLVADASAFSSLQNGLLRVLPEGSYELRYRYRYSPVVVLDLLAEDCLVTLAEAVDVEHVFLDQRGSGALQESRAIVRANEVFDLSLTGAGRVAAVLDAGIDSSHPTFSDAIIDEHHFLEQGTLTGSGAVDGHGHGSHVSGILASRGLGGAPRGIAPGVQLVSVKVLDDANRGWVSDWVAGLEYLAGLHQDDNGIRLDVVNMSLATNARFPEVCDDRYPAFRAACAALQELGVLLVAASGNNGSSRDLASPACLTDVFSVGMTTDTPPEAVASLSNRNVHLDILAPGAEITSIGNDGNPLTLVGTSFATPHVTGAVCLLRELRPELSAQELADGLRATGASVFDERSQLTFPRLDIYAAVELLGSDCDGSGGADIVEIYEQRAADCNDNGHPDACEIASGGATDSNGDGLIDACDARAWFRRGDVDTDGQLQITDALAVFNFLFLGGTVINCREAMDTNNDGAVVITDGIGIFNYLFFQGTAPAPPSLGGVCGLDPDAPGSVGDLGCDLYDACSL